MVDDSKREKESNNWFNHAIQAECEVKPLPHYTKNGRSISGFFEKNYKDFALS